MVKLKQGIICQIILQNIELTKNTVLQKLNVKYSSYFSQTKETIPA